MTEPDWCYRCGDYYANCEGDCWFDDDYVDEEFEDGCLYPDKCCMPGFHTIDECHTAEMMEEFYADLAKES